MSNTVDLIDKLVGFVDSYDDRMPPPLTVKNPFLPELLQTTRKLTTRGKGILAMDEFPFALEKRFTAMNLKNNEENRRRYRELLITSQNIEEYINGVIMYDATLYQKTTNGTSFTDHLTKKGILPGIKVDQFIRDLPSIPNGIYTQGITDLGARCDAYYKQGARFAKWRAVLYINNGYVSPAAIQENATTLAKYAGICQLHGLVPIVEPELMMDGDHSLECNAYWTEKILVACYKALSDYDVIIEATLLKPNMCIAGKLNSNYLNSIETSVDSTIRALKRSVPPAVPGIMFLSGGQPEEDATLRLNLINKLNNEKRRQYSVPWIVSFSFARALQNTCLVTWQGDDKNSKKAQNEFIKRCKANSDAQLGIYQSNANVSG